MNILNLGCGHIVVPEWTNLDIDSSSPSVIRRNFIKDIGLPDESYDAVYMSHVLEHIEFREVRSVIENIHRILKPGGVLRIVVPDLEEMAREYLAQIDSERSSGIRSWKREWLSIEILDQLVRKESGGLMRAWYENFGTRSNSVASYVYERVGQELSVTSDDYDDARISVWNIVNQSKGRKWPFIKKVSSKVPPGERHLWMWDEFMLRDLCFQSSFKGFKKLDFLTSTLGSVFHISDVDANFKPRKGRSSVYVEFIK